MLQPISVIYETKSLDPELRMVRYSLTLKSVPVTDKLISQSEYPEFLKIVKEYQNTQTKIDTTHEFGERKLILSHFFIESISISFHYSNVLILMCLIHQHFVDI